MGSQDPETALQELWDADPRLNPTLARAQSERLLPEVEDILRAAPSLEEFASDSGSGKHLAWLGRAAAALKRWDIVCTVRVSAAVMKVPSENRHVCRQTLATLTILLQQARSDLRMELDRGSLVVAEGGVFEYFNELRKVIETARTEVFFVDPYLDADFVSQYLPYVAESVSIRLLGGPKKRATLLPAVDLFTRQHRRSIIVRVSDRLHDRYLFVDRAACYLSGASFKDGAKNAPAVLTQITDAFAAMWDTYQRLWNESEIDR